MKAACDALARQGRFPEPCGRTSWPDGTVSACYVFVHDLYRETLYGRIPPRRRARLHVRIGERLETGYGVQARELAAELRFILFKERRAARRSLSSARWRSRLGTECASRGRRTPSAGSDLLASLPESAERAEHELAVQATLAPALMAIQGWGSPEVQSRISARRISPATGGSVASCRRAGRLGYYCLRLAAITGSRKRCWMSICVETQIIARIFRGGVTRAPRLFTLPSGRLRYLSRACESSTDPVRARTELLFSGFLGANPAVWREAGPLSACGFWVSRITALAKAHETLRKAGNMCTAWRWRRPRPRFYISTVANLCWLWKGLKRPSMLPPGMASPTGPL